MMKPCVNCGQLLEERSRCTDCATKMKRGQHRYAPRRTTREKGYTTEWRKLSERARRIQPWCTDCGSPEDLTADHSTEAWERFYAGLPIRLRDVDVVCRVCNIDRGEQRPGGMGWTSTSPTPAWQAESALHTGGFK